MLLNYEQIRMDGGTQPRAALQKEVMEDYAELMRSGVKFPPLVVFNDGENYWLADGFHRMGAALRAFPADPIEVEVIQGTLSDARWYSFGVNTAHGMRRTNADKERAVRAALAHPKAEGFSNRQIAEHCGVTETTVRRYRNSLAAFPMSNSDTSTSAVLKSRPRTGRDGRTINTARIGRQTQNTRKSQTISAHAPKSILGHKLPRPTVFLSLPPNDPASAAATILNLFGGVFVKSLIEELTRAQEAQEQ